MLGSLLIINMRSVKVPVWNGFGKLFLVHLKTIVGHVPYLTYDVLLRIPLSLSLSLSRMGMAARWGDGRRGGGWVKRRLTLKIKMIR